MLLCNIYVSQNKFYRQAKPACLHAIRFIISYNYKWFIAFHVKRVGKKGSKLFYLCGYILMCRNFKLFDEEIIILNIMNVSTMNEKLTYACFACIFKWK